MSQIGAAGGSLGNKRVMKIFIIIGETRAATVVNGNDRDLRVIDQDFNGSGGVGGFAFGRGHGIAGSGSRGRRGSFCGGSRSGQGASYRCKEGGVGSNGLVGDSGLVTEKSVPANPVNIPESLGEGSFKSMISCVIVGGKSSLINSHSEDASDLLESAKCDGDLLGEEYLEDGEFNVDCEDDVFNGELEDFAEFDGEFEFGVGEEVGNEIGDEERQFQDDVIKGKLEDVDNGMNGDVSIPIEEITMESPVGEKISATGELAKVESEIPGNDSVMEAEIQAMRDGKKKQV